jgi:hypothetical protein
MPIMVIVVLTVEAILLRENIKVFTTKAVVVAPQRLFTKRKEVPCNLSHGSTNYSLKGAGQVLVSP